MSTQNEIFKKTTTGGQDPVLHEEALEAVTVLQASDEEEQKRLLDLFDSIDSTDVPAYLDEPRTAYLEGARIVLEGELLSEIESRNRGTFSVGKGTYKLTKVDLLAFINGATRLIYNQSIQARNESRTGIATLTESPSGLVVTTLTTLARYAYVTETPTARQYKSTEALTYALHSTFAPFLTKQGERVTQPLCNIIRMREIRRGGDPRLILNFHPFFCDYSNGWVTREQDQMKRIVDNAGNLTPELYLLKFLIGRHRGTRPLVRKWNTLLKELDLVAQHESQPKRTTDKVLRLFETFKKAEAIRDYQLEEGPVKRGRRAIKKVTFIFAKELELKGENVQEGGGQETREGE